MERTYVMLKPDALKRGLMGKIITRIEDKGYKIINAKTIRLDEPILRAHYSHLVNKNFFPELLDYMMSGSVFAMIVEGDNVVLGIRKLMGATQFEDSVAGTIRGDYASNTTQNLIHGSDSAENAEIEIKRFF